MHKYQDYFQKVYENHEFGYVFEHQLWIFNCFSFSLILRSTLWAKGSVIFLYLQSPEKQINYTYYKKWNLEVDEIDKLLHQILKNWPKLVWFWMFWTNKHKHFVHFVKSEILFQFFLQPKARDTASWESIRAGSSPDTVPPAYDCNKFKKSKQKLCNDNY